MSEINIIMEQAQVFASGWSLVGGRFDMGAALDEANQSKAELRDLIAAALASAERKGADDERARIVGEMQKQRPVAWVRYASDGGIHGPLLDAYMDDSRREFWTPLVAADWADRSTRQAVLLTDEQLAAALCEIAPGEEQAADWTFVGWMRNRTDACAALDDARLIQASVLAANRMEAAR